MALDFKALKARSKAGTSSLAKKLEDMNSTGYTPDERIYRPSMSFDKANAKGYVVLRFLPCPNEDCDDFVSRKFYAFKGKSGWYNETSRKTLGMKEADPVSISNKFYFELSKEMHDDKIRDKARNLKENFYANVYIIKDDFKPDNVGKVFIMEFGKKIFEKLQSKIKPEYEDDEALNPFDIFTGANFKIKMSGNEIPDFKDPSKKTIVPNYDTSEFAAPSVFMEDEDQDKLLETINNGYDLSEFTTCKEFDVLAERFLAVTGEAYNKLEKSNPINEIAAETMKQMEDFTKVADESDKEVTTPTSDEDEDDDAALLAQFEKMANE